ncbi:unnamed protein product, partial [Discosporangium mesarthrocarpum]
RCFGVHLFGWYMIALAAVLAMALLCLGATGSGYFLYDETLPVVGAGTGSRDAKVHYRTEYGWRTMCSTAMATYVDATGKNRTMSEYGCFGLGETVRVFPLKLAGNGMTSDTALAVAVGHSFAALVAAVHIALFSLLYFNVDIMPVKAYPYMRGLGLLLALSSFYLLFTCVVSFYFGVKGSLDLHMDSSAGLRPSWAYILTV